MKHMKDVVDEAIGLAGKKSPSYKTILFCMFNYMYYIYIYIGVFEVPISQLQKPLRKSRLLREPIKENMKRDSTGPDAAPLVILCWDVTQPDEF